MTEMSGRRRHKIGLITYLNCELPKYTSPFHLTGTSLKYSIIMMVRYSEIQTGLPCYYANLHNVIDGNIHMYTVHLKFRGNATIIDYDGKQYVHHQVTIVMSCTYY